MYNIFMKTITKKLTTTEINKIISKYKKFEIESKNKYIIFFSKTNDFTISIYTTNKVVWQYKNNIELEDDKSEIFDSIINTGSDEVGTGDIFGPIVATSVNITSISDIEYLKKIGVVDSKKLSDKQIIKMAKKIINDKCINYETYIVSNKHLNKMWNTFNLNEIKMFAHLKSNIFNGDWIIDEFSSKKSLEKYQKRLYKENYISTLKTFYSETKAENKYISVATASVIARYYFLYEIHKLSIYLGEKIILGANEKAVEQYRRIKLVHSDVDTFAKLNFKNISNI